MRLLRRLFVLVLFVALLVGGWQFIANNGQLVSVNYLLRASPERPLWQIVIFFTTIGFVLGMLLLAFSLARSRLEARHYRKEAVGLERELMRLQNLPLEAVREGSSLQE